jgi:NAD(P)H-nitrite reductase large subunit
MVAHNYSADFVIIGGGIAGTTAAETIRKRAPNARVALLSDEPDVLYSKVLIPVYLKGKISRDRLYLRRLANYEDRGIDFYPDVIVDHIDQRRNEVFTKNGRIFAYKKLLIASGGMPTKLSDTLQGGMRMQTIVDADNILQTLSKIKNGVGLVVGESFIAMEFLEVFSMAGLDTNVLVRGNVFAESKFGIDIGKHIEDNLRDNGITVHKSTEISIKQYKDVMLKNGVKLTVDAVGVGVGLNFNMMPYVGIQQNEGIVTNSALQTSDTNIFAAGDIAEFQDVIAGRKRLVGNWMNAFLQGKHVGENMVLSLKNTNASLAEFRTVSLYNITNFGLHLAIIGDIEESDEIVDSISKNEDEVFSATRFFIRKGVIRGVALVNKLRDISLFISMIERGDEKTVIQKI